MSDDFRRAIEEIKLRAPVEDVVREYVPGLRKAGPLWVACCPFHDEKTPSFKVDPRRGTWHCFGACSEGGDQIRFVERFLGVGFREAIELLAARAGVELPRGAGARSHEKKDEHAAELDCLERATRFYEGVLRSSAGREAREYLERRGLGSETVKSFRLGFAPAEGRVLSEEARRAGVAFAALERAGLARRNDRGHAFDFFRGRLMIPIRDLEGRVVGFGARRLTDEAGGPKYVNTPETALFRKNRLIYGLDRALPDIRRASHLVLVEGYTDVMAAHQAGLANVVAVLGTSTTEEHTVLIRRTGARRVSLVFDGDDAGRKAAFKALHGLLPLELELGVVVLPGGADPCDLLGAGRRAEFEQHLAAASDWFEFVCAGLAGLSGGELAREVDRVLELLGRLRRPVHRESLLGELARRIGVPVESLREEMRRDQPGRRAPAAAPAPAARREEPARGRAAGLARQAYEGLVRAVLLDDGLVPAVRPHVPDCPDPELKRILEVVLELYEDHEALLTADRILTLLGEHPARRLVSGLFEPPEGLESPKSLLERELEGLRQRKRGLEIDTLLERIGELQDEIDRARLHPTIDTAAFQSSTGSASTASGASSVVPVAGELAAARRELERLRGRYNELVRAERPPGSPLTHSARSQPARSE